MAKNGSGAWAGFLVMAFIVLGLCGLFATYAVALPYQRELFAQARLDAAAHASSARDAQERLAGLQETLGEDGVGAFDQTGPLPLRIEMARMRLRRHFQAEGADIALRLRIVIAVFTFASALFGVMVVSVLRRTTG